MNWHPVSEHPAKGQRVLGLILNEYINARWSWSGPLVYRWDGRTFQGGECGHSFVQPTMWCSIELPPIPTTSRSAKAASVEDEQARLSDEIRKLERQRREVLAR